MNTKTKILNSAEELFADRGFENVSIREIITKASVNIAAINYHFGNKEELIFAVVKRRIMEVNNNRTELLEELRVKYQTKPIPVKKIIHGFIYPAFMHSHGEKKNGSHFLKLMGRIMSNSYPNLKTRVFEVFDPIAQEYLSELIKALPQMPVSMVSQKFYFTVGSMAHVLLNHTNPDCIKKSLQGEKDLIQIAEDLIEFCAGGFNPSPKMQVTKINAKKLTPKTKQPVGLRSQMHQQNYA